MSNEELRNLLESVSRGEASIDAALERLLHNGQQSVGDTTNRGWVELPNARIDTDRQARCGFPEVIYCESKLTDDLVRIAREIARSEGRAFGTRCSPEQAAAIKAEIDGVGYDPVARTVVVGDVYPQFTKMSTAVLAAGTSDRRVAEEACRTLEFFGAPVDRIYDVGVAGVHRLLDQRERILQSDVIIVVAGMEGALASVVGGLFPHPLIAVPTSVGYGASMAGLAALLGMLSSCASGISVVNIDNGYGAAMASLAVLRTANNGAGNY